MIVAMISPDAKIYGRSQGYFGLPVQSVTVHDNARGCDAPAIRTAWTPTPAELDKLNKGASVIVELVYVTIPFPMNVEVGEIPG